jgi:L-amino acid N-acyltransferase YncA
MEIRPAEIADAARVAEIYAYYVTETVVTFDLVAPSVGDWEGCLRTAKGAGNPVLVGCEDDRVVGYALVTAWKSRPAYRYTAEVSIYLDPAFTGAGRGRALLERLVGEARRAGIRQLIAVIADTGVVTSVALHRSLGFRMVGRMERVGFKHGRWIDVDLLQLDLHDSGGPVGILVS